MLGELVLGSSMTESRVNWEILVLDSPIDVGEAQIVYYFRYETMQALNQGITRL